MKSADLMLFDRFDVLFTKSGKWKRIDEWWGYDIVKMCKYKNVKTGEVKYASAKPSDMTGATLKIGEEKASISPEMQMELL